jgi:glycosyltransferase involved in cell wall biosynthesis
MTLIRNLRSWCAGLNAWRLRWNTGHLIGTVLGADQARRSLICRLLPGWYMVEVQVAMSRVQQAGTVTITYGNGCERHYGLQLHAGRVSKRLIHIEQLSHLHIATGSADDSQDLLHFRLVRVSRAFAASRMRTKLNLMHPRYRTSVALHRRGKIDKRADTAAIPVLWQDYCNVFDGTADIAPYRLWVQQFDVLTEQQVCTLAEKIATFEKLPVVSVVMPVFNPNLTWLAQAIESVRSQIYPHWQLCIADDASTDPRVAEMLRAYAEKDSRIVVHVRAQNGHISACSNDALALATGEWIALLDHDDLLSVDALLRMVEAINRHPEVRLLYSDEDKIDEYGQRSDPYFKCDWNRDLFYSQNMISHLGVYHTDLVREVGGFREGYEGAQDYDLALRCVARLAATQIHHIPRVLYHWRIHVQSTANGLDAKPYAALAGERALNDHFARTGVAATATAFAAGYRVRYGLSELPLVTIIIPTHNAVGLLRTCVNSIIERTTYPRYEVLIIDNRSDDPAALAYLRDIAKLDKVRVERDIRPFNYSAITNSAVRSANGEVVALLNNDVEVISHDWLDEMVSHAMRPDVGAVGAKLLYADDTVQHAGVILGVHGIAGHAHRFAPRTSTGYCGRAALVQSFSAVTAACLVVRKDLYDEVGGMNEKELAVACNDVDFCLRLGQMGYRTVWTPHAELYHHESATRGFDDTPEKLARSDSENAYMREHWGQLLAADPFYSPNLSLDDEDFTLAWPPRWTSSEQEQTGTLRQFQSVSQPG